MAHTPLARRLANPLHHFGRKAQGRIETKRNHRVADVVLDGSGRGLLLEQSEQAFKLRAVDASSLEQGSEIQITEFLFTRFGFLTDNSSAPACLAQP